MRMWPDAGRGVGDWIYSAVFREWRSGFERRLLRAIRNTGDFDLRLHPAGGGGLGFWILCNAYRLSESSQIYSQVFGAIYHFQRVLQVIDKLENNGLRNKLQIDPNILGFG